MKYGLLIVFTFLGSFAFASSTTEDTEKVKWIAETSGTNKEKLKKVDQTWVAGCLKKTAVYISKNRKINDGLSAEFNAENICALLTSDDEVKKHLKNNKDLKFQGCIDGIAMSMQMFDKSASNQKRKEVLAQYCF